MTVESYFFHVVVNLIFWGLLARDRNLLLLIISLRFLSCYCVWCYESEGHTLVADPAVE